MIIFPAWNGGSVLRVPDAWCSWRHNGVRYWRLASGAVWAQADGNDERWWFDVRIPGWTEGRRP